MQACPLVPCCRCCWTARVLTRAGRAETRHAFHVPFSFTSNFTLKVKGSAITQQVVRTCLNPKLLVLSVIMRHSDWSGPGTLQLGMINLSRDADRQSSISCPILQVPFDLLVAHVDESAACSPSEEESEENKQEIWQSVVGFIDQKAFLHLPLEDVYLLNTSGSGDPKSRLDRRKQMHSLVQVKSLWESVHHILPASRQSQSSTQTL